MMVPMILLAALAGGEPETLDRITVVSGRAPRVVERDESSVTLIGRRAIEHAGAAHPNELFARVPGAWISRGSGQEQLTAIRSPVLSGTGACGAFLFLEDGVPMRPAGMCNVNQLFELDTEQAGAIEVLRGPGTAVHGSNALHGVVNVRPAPIGTEPESIVGFEAGGDAYRRLALRHSDGERWRIDTLAVSSGSFRALEGFDQQKLSAQWQAPDAPGAPRLLLSASNLNQETAGFVTGLDAYRDARRRLNQNPEAYRDADSQRLQGRWTFFPGASDELVVVPYVRRDAMQFLQHFAPGKPLERNGSDSAGLQLMWRRDGAMPWQLGADIEHASGSVLERQDQALTEGSPLQQAIRPVGRHYDYRVEADTVAAFAQLSAPVGARVALSAGLRAETMRYRYDNRMAAGNLREDGSACSNGGCLFNRPADRSDRFDGLNAQFGASLQLDPTTFGFARLANAFRFPQAAELYRLQRGQDVADLQREQLDSFELGLRGGDDTRRWELAGYTMRKRNVILRDAQGFNLSDGRTRHRGVGLALDWRIASRWRIDLNAAYAIQRYDFDRDIAAGERIRRGDEIDTAPRWLGAARLAYQAGRAGEFELEWVHQGGYFEDAANSARYPGHDLVHLRWQQQFGPDWALSARITNLADRRYAERADFAFGDHRYFPGAGRSLFVGVEYRRAARR